MFLKVFVLMIIVKVVTPQIDFDAVNSAFDPSFYEDALDPELCRTQLAHIRRLRNVLSRMRFLDSGYNIPRSILEGNTLDMGNYRQCLGINEEIDDSVIEGKYCMIRGPINENFINFAKSLDQKVDASFYMNNETLKRLKKYEEIQSIISLNGLGLKPRSIIGSLPDVSFRIAVCVPKTCTVREGIQGILLNVTTLPFQFEEQFCRLNNDKPWVAADYVAISIFSFIGLLTLLSTGYDVWHTLVSKKDPNTANIICCSFSVYTNTRRLMTFTDNPNALKCIDGIRTLAMLWVIVGHTYQTLPPQINVLDAFKWLLEEWYSVWITSAHFTVDTFFFLTGLLTVYTTAGKMTSMKLLKNLHFYYLTRLLRMFPLLATVVLLQSSIFHRIADGPLWSSVSDSTQRCRMYWWSTLLYVQNYLQPGNDCISHSWYLAIDMQLYIVSPLILFWVLKGDKKTSWIALTAGLIVTLTICTTYSFIKQFPGWLIAPPRGSNTLIESVVYYMKYYYFHALPRAPCFAVGMVFGYLLHLWRGKKFYMHRALAVFLWICAIGLTSTLMYITHLMKDFQNWDTRFVDDLMNSFARPLWGVAMGWIVFACHKGYGGPINWFLCLNLWKLPSRISYAMYLFSFPLQFIRNGTALAPIVFSDALALYEFASQVVITFIVSFVFTVLIDSPFSTLFKLLLEGPKKPKKEVDKK